MAQQPKPSGRAARGAEAAPPTLQRRADSKVMSSHDQIVRALGEEIVGDLYPPGANLPPESVLLNRFGVSRTVLREVMKTLTAKGLVVAKTRIGTRVLDPENWNFFDPDVLAWKVSRGMDQQFRSNLAEIRRALEPAAAALAAKRRSKADLLRLRACVAAMQAETTSGGFAKADLDFHIAVGAASGNPMMRSVAGVIEAALIEAFSLSTPMRTHARHSDAVAAHTAIIDAIEARDEQAAADAMMAVIDAGVDRIEKEKRADSGARKPKPTSQPN